MLLGRTDPVAASSPAIRSACSIALVEGSDLRKAGAWSPAAGRYENRVSSITADNKRLLERIGAWRHVGAVLGSRDPRSDAAALARLTGVPPVLWLASFVLALGLASWLAAAELLGAWS